MDDTDEVLTGTENEEAAEAVHEEDDTAKEKEV